MEIIERKRGAIQKVSNYLKRRKEMGREVKIKIITKYKS